ncbi:hypothetical protein MN608_02712 [Microdochium nivale]|nr:hypothetical protein MN608_02712 [Microdochium nivale]
MVCLTGPSFFQRKERTGATGDIKSIISGPINIEEQPLNTRTRLHSMTSNSSRSSSESDDSSSARSFNPLQSHPPLQINASPIAETRYTGAMSQDGQRQQSRDGPSSNMQFVSVFDDDSDDESTCTSRRTTYVYDQGLQWPLKDWQTIPPGLARAQESSEFSTPLSPRPAAHQRRPTEWMNEPDRFVKRGSWKRRGIIFGSDAASEEEAQRHFELPE